MSSAHQSIQTSYIHRLLIIDPQNDFCDIDGATLPVAGASADLVRLAQFVQHADGNLDQIVVTLDSHPSIAIERPAFWRTADGTAVNPFTLISPQDIMQGTYVPADARLKDYVLRYTQALQAQGKYVLCVWPTHCVMGTWGQAIYEPLQRALHQWQITQGKNMDLVFKGMHPLTEQYSAVRAEVPFDIQMLHPSAQSHIDAQTDTNRALLSALFERPEGDTREVMIYCSGQALSHCVKATVQDLMALAPAHVHFTILTDTSSSVGGFESQGHAFLDSARAAGARTQDCASALMQL